MTTKEKLSLYKKALRDYRLAQFIPLFKYFNYTYEGFCLYFKQVNNEYLYYLSELCEQNPNKVNTNLSFWFPKGELKPRIECLKRAIKFCEQELKQ
jgi:hypothetical protein